nr:aspartic peptidase [Tanacetum cinerariifolium]GEX16838.1 aspartic peptidase [Tanacetum cinerariifolium]
MHFIKILLHLLALFATFQGYYSDADPLRDAKTPTDCNPSSSILFQVTGNIYPDGYRLLLFSLFKFYRYYYVTVCLGDPSTPYHLDFDTESHFTWIQCDAPCQKCLPAPHPPYKPVTWKVVGCTDPTYTNGTVIKPDVSFGCGYHQKHPDPKNLPYVDGILGLGSGKEGILSQLRELENGTLGSCRALCWWISNRVRNLHVLFDSGTTFSFFAPKAYSALVSMVTKDIKEKQLYIVNDEYLPVCWRGSQPFESIQDVKNIFKPIALSFENSQNTWIEMDPEAYLIITRDGNVCLGILDSATIEAPTVTLIGAISFFDKLVIYDNENQKIGWTTANCKDPPQSECH